MMPELWPSMDYISHPLVRGNTLERRLYQVSIAATALRFNTLVILPTGLGKTAIALLVIASRLISGDGKVLVLSPTRPLVEQHAGFFRNHLKLEDERIVALTGDVSPEKRKEMWSRARIIVSTPQVIENDLISGRISLKNVMHITFDEAHRAVGKYPYVYIAERYMKEGRNPLILAMTASPGSDPERIREVCDNLHIEEIEARTEFDEDVVPYIYKKKIEWIKVEIPPDYKRIKGLLEDFIKIRLRRLRDLGVIQGKNVVSKKEFLMLQERIQKELSRNPSRPYFEALSIIAEIMKVKHGIELIETQGAGALRKYMEKLAVEAGSRGGSKASKSILSDVVFRKAMNETFKCETEHPKLQMLRKILMEQISRKPDSRIIVFTNFRDSAEMITKYLAEIDGFRPERFVGQANRENDRGMSQKKQIEALERFRNGESNILVATSVAEEGLDIPSTDLVVFYEAVPSEIRAIQRKGRTGRGKMGRVVVLMGRGTRDEGYYWASSRKEKKMYEQISRLKSYLREYLNEKRKRGQMSLTAFVEEKPSGLEIYADVRESRSGIVKRLSESARVVVKQLDVADYVLSDRVGVERKTVDDFLESMVNKNRDLFGQLIELRKAYSKPLLIIEGSGLYTRRRIHPNAIRGAIVSVILDFNIPIIFTENEDETADVLISIARREQEDRQREIALHSGKTSRTLKEEQEYIVSAISGVGPVIAKNLLRHFQTIENIVNASKEELEKVEKVGPKIAERIRKIVSTRYGE